MITFVPCYGSASSVGEINTVPESRIGEANTASRDAFRLPERYQTKEGCLEEAWKLGAVESDLGRFHDGIIVMCRLVMALRRKSKTYDDWLLLCGIGSYKQEVLKSLVDKLRSAKHVLEASGFARETIESKIFDLWKSVFDEEAKEATESLQAIRSGVINDLFKPISGKPQHGPIRALPHILLTF